MKRLCSCVGLSVVLCFGWLSAVTSACPVATGVVAVVPVPQVQIAVPIVAAPIIAAQTVVVPPTPAAVSIAVPALSVVATPVAVIASPVVVEKIRVRSSRQFRTPIRSLLFR